MTHSHPSGEPCDAPLCDTPSRVTVGEGEDAPQGDTFRPLSLGDLLRLAAARRESLARRLP